MANEVKVLNQNLHKITDRMRDIWFQCLRQFTVSGQGRLRTIGKPKSTVMIIFLQAETRQAQKLSDPCVMCV